MAVVLSNNPVCVDVFTSLVDLEGTLRENRLKNSSPDYTPNNIRRVIISPDCVCVHYYYPINGNKGSGLTKQIMVDKAKLYKAYGVDSQDYCPITSAFVTNPCNGIEEIIWLTRSNFNDRPLDEREYANESNLLKNYKDNGNFLEALSRRYSRLRGYTVVDMSYNEFNTLLQKARESGEFGRFGKAKNQFIFDCDFIKNAIVIKRVEVQSVDTCLSNRPYVNGRCLADGSNGKFTLFIDKEVKDYKDLVKKNAINEMKNKNLSKELIQKTEKEVTNYIKYWKLVSVLFINLNKGHNENFVTGFDESFHKEGFYNCESFKIPKDYINPNLKAKSEYEAISKNSEIAVRGTKQIYEILSNMFFENFIKLHATKPITAKIYATELKSGVQPSAKLKSEAEYIGKAIGKTFGAKNLQQSIVESAYNLAVFTLDRNYEKFDQKFVTLDYWQRRLTNA